MHLQLEIYIHAHGIYMHTYTQSDIHKHACMHAYIHAYMHASLGALFSLQLSGLLALAMERKVERLKQNFDPLPD